MDDFDGVEQFYSPELWRVSIRVGDALIFSGLAPRGHHLALAAGELLRLYTGIGETGLGMLDPANQASITVTITPEGSINPGVTPYYTEETIEPD